MTSFIQQVFFWRSVILGLAWNARDEKYSYKQNAVEDVLALIRSVSYINFKNPFESWDNTKRVAYISKKLLLVTKVISNLTYAKNRLYPLLIISSVINLLCTIRERRQFRDNKNLYTDYNPWGRML